MTTTHRTARAALIETMPRPNVTNIKRENGVAGQFIVRATVTYPGEAPETIEFIGSTYGGPVWSIGYGHAVLVTDPGRFGNFATDSIEWVRRYFA